jgi:hypothetical protein
MIDIADLRLCNRICFGRRDSPGPATQAPVRALVCNWLFQIKCMISVPASVTAAVRKDTNPNIGCKSRLMARWVLFEDVVEVSDLTDLDARLSFGIVDFAHRVAPLVSVVIFSGVPFHLIAMPKNHSGFAIPFGGQQKIHRGAGLIDRPIQVCAGALDRT